MTKDELVKYLDAVCAAETGIIACNGAISVYQRELSQVTCSSNSPREPRLKEVEPPAAEKKKVIYKPRKMNIAQYIFRALCWPLFLPNTLPVSSDLQSTLTSIGIVFVFVFFAAWANLGDGFNYADLLQPLQPYLILTYLIGLVLCPFLLKKQEATEQQQYEADCLAAEQEYEAACKRNMEAYEERKRDAETAYNVEMHWYNSAMAQYHEELKIVQAARDAIQTRIRQQQTFRAELQKRLDNLYAQDVLYPNFRSLIAAYQIREYLKMGMCEELTGPTGAYAVYMNDVRTARVCDSIHELQQNLVSAIGGLQSTLALELQTMQHHLSSLESSVHENLQGISQSMQTMHRDYQLGLDNANHHLELANRQLANVQADTAAIVAHNRYVEQRLHYLDTYKS